MTSDTELRSRSEMTSRARAGARTPIATWLLYAVTALGFVYLFVPLVTIVVFTFNQPRGRFNTTWQRFTWDNWRHAFERSDYTDAFLVSVQVALVACVAATVLGGLLALAIGRYRMRGGAAINLLLVLPLAPPEIVLGASFFTLFFDQGVTLGFWTVVLAHTMFCLSFAALTLKARVRSLDWTLEEAAADLGSPPLRTFVKVTLPLLLPGIAAAFLLSLALSVDDYITTSFVAGATTTFPKEVFDSTRATIPPQVHVIATLTMLIAIAILVLSTVSASRRRG